MAIVYHGISFENAIPAASRGVVLSTLDERIEEDEVKFCLKHGVARDKCWKLTTEKIQIANLEWELERKKMAPEEIVISTQYVPVVTEIDILKIESLGWKNADGGVILGVFIDDPILARERAHDSDPSIRYVRGRLELMWLQEVYISKTATKEQAKDVFKAFAKYAPHFYKINQ
jgi:hypothetical protein